MRFSSARRLLSSSSLARISAAAGLPLVGRRLVLRSEGLAVPRRSAAGLPVRFTTSGDLDCNARTAAGDASAVGGKTEAGLAAGARGLFVEVAGLALGGAAAAARGLEVSGALDCVVDGDGIDCKAVCGLGFGRC